tara:strand:- start:12878 stop:13711 length:834 start_codon:yes stop_codon:yes gene_type:complete
MAKKKNATVEAVEEQVMEQVVETVVAPVKPPVVENKEPAWEIKDRVYLLKDGMTPLSYRIASTKMFYFDEEVGFEREMAYCPNQKTVFTDEMQGRLNLGQIVFRNGTLRVPRNQQTLQRLLSFYHPAKDVLYEEMNVVKDAVDELDTMEIQLEAMNAANDMDIDLMEAIMRTELGSKVSSMSSKELRRDCMVFARKNPELFLGLADDEDIELRNFGIRANELGIIKLSSDRRTFVWNSTGQKMMTIPFGEHPYSALSQWFKTDEGMGVLKSIEKRLS